MNTGVVLGRFQIDVLHKGHLYLLEQANKLNDKLVIVVGCSVVPFTNRDPLTFSMRKAYLHELYPNADIIPIMDVHDNDAWCASLDILLDRYENVTLYGSRDSFIKTYVGVNKTHYIDEVPDTSATNRRKDIKNDFINHSHFRAGVIHVAENVFPTAYATTDVAVLRLNENGTTDVLLGRKENEELFRFIGGFVDPEDKSMEDAAWRELHEEVKGIMTHELRYVCSCKIPDSRYNGTKHGIITTFFKTWILGGRTEPADDIFELKWFKLEEGRKSIIPQHDELYGKLLDDINQV